MPDDVPGFYNVLERKKALIALYDSIQTIIDPATSLRRYKVGKGYLFETEAVFSALDELNILPEGELTKTALVLLSGRLTMIPIII